MAPRRQDLARSPRISFQEFIGTDACQDARIMLTALRGEGSRGHSVPVRRRRAREREPGQCETSRSRVRLSHGPGDYDTPGCGERGGVETQRDWTTSR
ncbi:hypothetical protein DPEC_G00102910 [Dallia pectoralis]|uniref:Uncharacterized protein n=1 Tax=Dallia pectoralis TaxID=75939 RepID=A0ACC2GXR9_DALPE|nr:hypothetical protein DPEC_G00102910 [Dallia pectoralis]